MIPEKWKASTVYEQHVITEWPKDRSDYEWIMEGVKSGEIVLFTGIGFYFTWETPHHCDCEFCEKETESDYEWFHDKAIMEKFIDDESIQDYEIVDDYYFIRAVRQNKDAGILFQGGE